MIRHTIAAAAFAIMLWPLGGQAAEKTIVLNVDNATCELCAPIIKKSLSSVSGVKAVDARDATDASSAVATVTFDDEVTGVPALIAATTNAGYPSHLAN
jgi:mercuric ion binding protein